MVPLVRSTKEHKKEAEVEVAVGDHRASNIGGCLGQGLSETTGEGRCFGRQRKFSFLERKESQLQIEETLSFLVGDC